jgi:glutamine synthetase type III
MPAFLVLRDEIEQAMVVRSARHATVAAAVPNVAEQIQQLAALHGQGILTEAEFETKKAELVARM